MYGSDAAEIRGANCTEASADVECRRVELMMSEKQEKGEVVEEL